MIGHPTATKSKSRYSWRKQPNEAGLARVCQRPRGMELRFAGATVGHVAHHGERSFYWYGCGVNSLHFGASGIYSSMSAAMDAFERHVREAHK